MERYLKLCVLPLVLLLAWTGGCRKTEDLSSRVAEMEFVSDLHKLNGEIDEWIYQNITLPYNIRLQWRWDRSETDLDRAVTPVNEAQVIPVGQMLLTYYLEPYKAEAGEEFVKRYPPKLYALYGSASYNTNGTRRLGSADAGRKVVLYTINERDFSEYNPTMERILKTVHHEFGHILDQNRRVSPAYGLISNQAHYAEDEWTDVYSDNTTLHLDRGFITPYAGSEPSEDFVEVIATLLAYGQEWFDNEVARANLQGRDMLRQKEGLVVDYFKSNWDIDFRSLQRRITNAKPLPPFLDFVGEGKPNTYFQLSWSNVPSESAEIWGTFNAESVNEANRALSYYRFTPLNDGKMLVRVARFAAGAGTTGNAHYARIFFDMTDHGDGTVSFTYSTSGTDPFGNYNYTGGSSAALRGNSDNLVAFLEGSKFAWEWTDNTFETGGLWAVDANGQKTGIGLIGTPGNYPQPQPFLDVVGQGKTNNYAQLSWSNVPAESAGIWATFNTESVSEADREISYYRFSPLNDGKMLIRVARFAVGAGTTGSAAFARIFFEMTDNGDGTVRFTYSQPGTDPFGTPSSAGSQAALRTNSDNLVAFLEGSNFVWDWTDETLQSGGLWAVDAGGEKTGVALLATTFGNQ